MAGNTTNLKILRFRGGTNSEAIAFTGKDREIVVDTTNYQLRTHDGSKQGGYAIALKAKLPTKTSEFENDTYLTSSNLTSLSQLTDDVGYWKKSDLTKISQLTNDSNFRTGYCSYCSHCSYCTNCS